MCEDFQFSSCKFSTILKFLRTILKSVSDATLSLLEEFLKTKQTVILDGSTDQRTDCMRINRLAREYGYKVLFVWVQTDPATAKHRWIKAYGRK
ncbi:AAA family ATPase [Candidatus Minimicrobia naudis]